MSDLLVPGEYADVLRVIGRLLDAQDARMGEIYVQDSGITVSWLWPRGARELRSYRGADFHELRERAVALRAGLGVKPQGERGELLRTLGQDLDQQGITLDRISEGPGGFRLLGRIDTQTVTQWYAFDELRVASQERRRLRNQPISHQKLRPVARARPPRPGGTS